jgi:DNA ligase-1
MADGLALSDLAATAERVAATSKRTEKVAAVAELLRHTPPYQAPIAVGLLLAQPRQGRLGVGWASLGGAPPEPARESSLTIHDVDLLLTRLAEAGGEGSQRQRAELLHDLLTRATESEQRFLRSALLGEMRIGANDGVVADGVAKAAGRPLAEVRRAAMLLGDLGEAARLALQGGDLATIGLRPSIGVQPMLASTAASVADALKGTGPASVEWKLDGARVQVHRTGDEVRIFSRSLRRIEVPEIVAAVADLPGGDLVLDGEALGLDPDGAPLKFQDSMSKGSHLQPFFFDVLHAGESLIDRPLAERKLVLADLLPQHLRLPTVDTDDAQVAAAFAEQAVATGHEGVMVKALDSTYDAGRRGAAWRKVKPVHTLDLVVLAAEWGHGRRRGWLSNLHLGARSSDGSFVMVGKTFKGLTDELLRWQTERFPTLALASDEWVVHLRPEVVVEIAVDGVQRSTRYPGGVALRFARVKRYRPDKSTAEADTIERVQAML